MKCDICNKETNKTIPFYWGFFKTNYEPDKWINSCEKCSKRFIQASNIYNLNKEELIKLEQEIKENQNKRQIKILKK